MAKPIKTPLIALSSDLVFNDKDLSSHIWLLYYVRTFCRLTNDAAKGIDQVHSGEVKCQEKMLPFWVNCHIYSLLVMGKRCDAKELFVKSEFSTGRESFAICFAHWEHWARSFTEYSLLVEVTNLTVESESLPIEINNLTFESCCSLSDETKQNKTSQVPNSWQNK